MKYEYKHLKPYLQDLLRDIKSNKPKSKTQVFRESLSFPFARTKTELLKNKKKFVDLYPRMMSALINMVCDQQKYGKGSTYDTGYYIINSLPKNREYFAVTFTVREGNVEPSVVYEDGITQGGGHGFVITLQLACKEKNKQKKR